MSVSVRYIFRFQVLLACWLAIAAFSGCEDVQSSEEYGGVAQEDSRIVVETLSPVMSDETGKISHSFKVVNPEKHKIRILDVKKSCNCTTSSIAERELDPGETTTLSMEVDLRGRSGLFSTQSVLHFDNSKPLTYQLKIPIYNRNEFIPNLLEIGSVSPGQSIERKITVLSHDVSTLPSEPVLQVARGYKNVSLERVRSSVDKLPGRVLRRTTEFLARFEIPSVAGLGFFEVVVASETEHPFLDRNDYQRVTWLIKAPYTCTPSRVFFGNIESSEKGFVRQVTIQRDDLQEFKVLDARSDCEAVSIECASLGQQAKSHQVHFTIDPSVAGRFVFGHAELVIDDERQTKVKIPLVASK